MTFADILKKERMATGLTQEELSGLCGISQHTWSRYERGEWIAKGERLNSIADALGVSCDYLLGRTEERKNPAL